MKESPLLNCFIYLFSALYTTIGMMLYTFKLFPVSFSWSMSQSPAITNHRAPSGGNAWATFWNYSFKLQFRRADTQWSHLAVENMSPTAKTGLLQGIKGLQPIKLAFWCLGPPSKQKCQSITFLSVMNLIIQIT